MSKQRFALLRQCYTFCWFFYFHVSHKCIKIRIGYTGFLQYLILGERKIYYFSNLDKQHVYSREKEEKRVTDLKSKDPGISRREKFAKLAKLKSAWTAFNLLKLLNMLYPYSGTYFIKLAEVTRNR